MRRLLVLLLLAGCAHLPLSPRAAGELRSVAVVARVADGPHARVFREDPAWHARLAERKLEDPEGDRRLALALEKGTFEKLPEGGKRLVAHTMSRFELAETLRAGVVAGLPRQPPWTSLASPNDVARELESYLVQDVSGASPDYQRLKRLGVDAVLEVLVEDYGLRSEKGRCGAYLVGTASLTRLDGGTLYLRRFVSDEVTFELESADPFAVARDASLFARRLEPILAAVAQQLVADLSPRP